MGAVKDKNRKKSLLEKKLGNSPEWKVLRKQERKNMLFRYCKIVNYAIEVGFFYDEAREYAISLLRLRK